MRHEFLSISKRCILIGLSEYGGYIEFSLMYIAIEDYDIKPTQN